jgi:energy-converting hydrogenase Eha subunit B
MRLFRFILGFLTAVVGVAALFWAFSVWVGTSLDKEPYPAGLIAQLSVACVVGLFLLLAAIHLVRGSVED